MFTTSIKKNVMVIGARREIGRSGVTQIRTNAATATNPKAPEGGSTTAAKPTSVPYPIAIAAQTTTLAAV
jgi:hypothetical protein